MRKRFPEIMAACLLCCAFVATAALTACGDDGPEVFDQPFVRIATEAGASQTVVQTDVKAVNTYPVYLSARAQRENLEVSYEIVVGDGLQEGVDFQVVTTENPLVFLPGIFTMPIRIRWMEHPVDASKDNTLTIRLTGCSRGFTLGFPGPDHLQRQVVIEKRN
jgi:hypothetical protein